MEEEDGRGSFGMGGWKRNQVFEEEAAGPVKGVASMSMGGNPLNSSGSAKGYGKERVSGWNSYMGSSSESANTKGASGEYISMQDRLLMARGLAVRMSIDIPEVAMDIDKQKHGMETVNAEKMEAWKQMGGNSKVIASAAMSDSLSAEHGDLPAKRYKTSMARRTHLTGARDEPRQEQ